MAGFDRRSSAEQGSPLPLLLAFLGLLLLLPVELVVKGPLKSNGSPAGLLALVAGVLWLLSFLSPGRLPVGVQPMRWVLGGFAISLALSVAVGGSRVLDPIESSGMTRSLVAMATAIGLTLYAMDAIRTRKQVDQLLTALSVFGGLVAVIVVVQFATGFDYAHFIKLPGMDFNNQVLAETRSGFRRVQGTAGHPIEMGVVLAAIFPIALTLTLGARAGGRRLLLQASTVAIVMAMPMTVSRSAVLGLAVAIVMLAVTWGWRRRLNLLVAAIALAAVMKVMVPGLLGTIRSLFTNALVDPSISGRTKDYGPIFALFDERPLFGRGTGTFRPDQYFFLDNQWLLTLVEAGIIGVIALAFLYLVGMSLARGVRHRSPEPSDQSIGQALAASVAVFAVAGATFDEFSFRQATLLLFFLLGVTAALWRVTRDRFGDARLTAMRSRVRAEDEPADLMV